MEIIFDNVDFRINKNTELEKIILKDIVFKINKSGIYSFFGNSNSGKTCIGELIDALIKPTKGRVIVNDFINNGNKIKNVNKLRFMVGYAFKNPYDMFLNKTVKEAIEFGMQYFKYKLEKIKLRAIDALKMVGLDESYFDKNPLELNLTEAKKVSLASILVYNPKIIILDEPTIGLNYKEKKELARLLTMLRDKYHKIIILLSRDSNFLYPLVDYVYLMDKSRIITEGDRNIFHEVNLLKNLGLEVPKIVEFISVARKEKNAKLENYKDIKDLIKGVYRNVF